MKFKLQKMSWKGFCKTWGLNLLSKTSPLVQTLLWAIQPWWDPYANSQYPMILETRQGRRNPVRNITPLKLKLKSPSYDNSKEHEIETRSATKFIRTHTSRPHATDPVKISKCAWKVVIVLSCIATMVMFAETILIPAIPDLNADFMCLIACPLGFLLLIWFPTQ